MKRAYSYRSVGGRIGATSERGLETSAGWASERGALECGTMDGRAIRLCRPCFIRSFAFRAPAMVNWNSEEQRQVETVNATRVNRSCMVPSSVKQSCVHSSNGCARWAGESRERMSNIGEGRRRLDLRACRPPTRSVQDRPDNAGITLHWPQWGPTVSYFTLIDLPARCSATHSTNSDAIVRKSSPFEN